MEDNNPAVNTNNTDNEEIIDLSHVSKCDDTPHNYLAYKQALIQHQDINNESTTRKYSADKISYTELNTMATELCRTVANKQSLARETYLYLKDWINKLKTHDSVELQFICCDNQLQTDDRVAMPATIGATNSNRIGKRFKSCFEKMNLPPTKNKKREWLESKTKS